MRPSDAFGRARPAESDRSPSFQAPGGSQMTYFLASESDIDASVEQSPHRIRDPRKLPHVGKADLSTPPSPSSAEPSRQFTDSPSEPDRRSMDLAEGESETVEESLRIHEKKGDLKVRLAGKK